MSPRRAIKLAAAVMLAVIMIYFVVILVWWRLTMPSSITPHLTPDAATQQRIDELLVNPDPEPIYLTIHEPSGSEFSNGERPCVHFNQVEFYDKGLDTEKFSDHIAQRTKLTVNGQEIHTLIVTSMLIAYNSRGVAGPGWMEYCFTLNLPRGDHLFALETEALDGTQYRYEWVWHIK